METVGDIPEECLTPGEKAGVWSGWTNLGDREVVREASAKGNYIDLAFKFLAYRRHWTIGDAQKYFYSEVEIWINELLAKKQIHRASHILEKVGKQPVAYISSICVKSREPELRDYLANHVMKKEGFSEEQIEAWEMIKCIKKYEETIPLSKDVVDGHSLATISIEELLNLSSSVKIPLLTELFFHTYEECLAKKLKNSAVWDYLLSEDKIELLISWVDRQFGEKQENDQEYGGENADQERNGEKCEEIEENTSVKNDNKDSELNTKSTIEHVFDRLEITPEMIENIDHSTISAPFKEMLLDHLCRYGIFIFRERKDMKLTLARFFSAKITPKEFESILFKESCNLDRNEFLSKKQSILFYQNEENAEEELFFKDQQLLGSLNKWKSSENCGDFNDFISAICKTICRIANDEKEFLKNEPMMAFYLILLKYLEGRKKSQGNNSVNNLPGHSEDICTINSENNYETNSLESNDVFKEVFTNFEKFLTDKTTIKVGGIEIAQDIITEVLKKIPYLKDCLENKKKENDVTIYQLLDGYKNLNVQELFKWRFSGETIPNFSNESLIKKYGHREKLTYKYYLKEARPSMAAYVLLNPGGKPQNLSSKMKSKIAFQAHTFALKNLNSPAIVCTCISFIEFLGVDSECLRLHATAADYVNTKLSISINDLLESVTYESSKDLAVLLNYLEQSFSVEFGRLSLDNVVEFVKGLKSWDFIVRFARAHNTCLPTSFLKYLAEDDCWLEFVLVGNIFRYPLEQMLENAAHFEDPNLREHLLICLNNPHLSLQNPSYNLQNFKQRKHSKATSKHTYGILSGSSQNSTTNSLNSPASPQNKNITAKSSPFDHDLWQTILKSHQSQDPPGALLKAARETLCPVLIVLAACYEPSSTATHCYSWLVISTEDVDFIESYSDCLNDQIWLVRRVSELFRNLMGLEFINTLSRGFEIFLPCNPLNLFFKFLRQCIKFCEFEESQKILVDFIGVCATLKSNRMIDWEDADITYLTNEYWIATVCIDSIIKALGSNFRSTHTQQKFLNVLVECNFNEELQINEPDFQSLLDIVTTLSKTNVEINFDKIRLDDGEYNIMQEVEECIKKLVEDEDFQSALELAKIAHLSCSPIILEQYRNEFKKGAQDASKILDAAFWRRCAADVRKYDVAFEEAASFFIEHAEKVESYKESYEILELAWKTLKPIATDQQIIDTVEMAMWKACILAGPAAIEILRQTKQFHKLKTELLAGISNLRVSCSLNDEAEEKAIHALIDRFLDLNDIDTALRIAAIFNYKHKDLQIIMLCLSLAEGEISSYQLSAQQLALTEPSKLRPQKVSTLTNRGLTKRFSSSSSNLSSPSSSNDKANLTIPQYQVDCIIALEKLIQNLEHGVEVGNKVLLLYKLSTQLKRTYRTLILSRDPMDILFEITKIKGSNKFSLFDEIISAYKIKNADVMKFLAGEIVFHVTRHVKDNLDDSMEMWGYPLDVTLNLSTVLCEDSTPLGWELLKGVSMRLGLSLGAQRDIETLKIVVELLIKAHDCFTSSCSMEGIAAVLRKCQQLANTLQSLKLWSLLVRLVTGVGRFTEMNYILQILKENDQFEFLLGIGTDKISGLKIALLEFCKKQYPDDKELFVLIAHHFRLYNEIAVMWETEANSVIRDLIRDTRRENIRAISMNQMVKLAKTENTEKRLQCAMTNYTHATDYYLRDNKLNLANRCCHQAQLVALQVSLLNAVGQNQQVACLLNLGAEEINKVIIQGLSFPQAMMLVQSYNYSGDWSSAIYHHVVIGGETKYLKDFMGSMRLTSAIVQDCVCRYRTERQITKQMTVNMKNLISELSDIEAKYVLASQLGFKEIVENLLSNETTGSYLKDTVWKQGFNPQEFIGENLRR